MPSPRPWIITPHESIVEHEPNLWSVSGDIPGISGMNRVMSIVKLQDDRLVFYNAIPLDELLMHKVTQWGKPWLLITPHRAHTMDAHSFSTRLKLKTAAPDVELTKVRQRVPDAVALSTITTDASLTIGKFDGNKFDEPWLIARNGSSATLITSDVIQNSNPKALLLRLLGFGGGPKVVPAQKLFFMKDKAAVKKSILALSAEPGLKRWIPSHGDVLDQDVPGTLSRIAQAL